MYVLDLFSGIGGFSLGFERAGFETVAFAELDDACRAVLGRHWPEVLTYADVSDLSGIPLSGSVGSGQASRPIRLQEFADVRADWVVIENTGHRWRAWVPELRRELWSLGYASVCLRVRAVEVGAVHERSRAIVVAHTYSEPLRELSRWWGGKGRQVADELAESWDSAPRRLGANDGLPDWVDRRKQLGNAVSPYVAQLVARAIEQQ